MRRALLVRAALALLGPAALLPRARADAVGDFFRAIVQDDAGAMRWLLARGVDPNARNDKGVPGLVLALKEERLQVAQVLLDSPRLKPDESNPAGESPLMIAALEGQLAIARRLIALDAAVNKPGWTPLHYAATHGHLAMMELLLEHYAFIDAQAPNGNTPLMMAAQYGSPEAVKLLIQAGADLRLRNRQGETALDLAQRTNRRNSAELLIEGLRRSQGVPRGQW